MRGILMATLGVAAGLSTPGQARAQSCEDLFYQRNVIYKAQGYCFRTQRAIAMFGNAGCVYDDVNDVPLSPRQRREVEAVKALEQETGCR